MSLLREKRLVIQGIKLHGVFCDRIRNKAEKGNWEQRRRKHKKCWSRD